MIRKTRFMDAGGFSEQYQETMFDVDLCLKLRGKGYYMAYTPFAELQGGDSGRYSLDYGTECGTYAKDCGRLKERWGKMLEKPGFSGWAVDDFRKLPPQGGYGLGPEMDRCLRELALARALLACGDWQGKGRAVYEAYARDPRGVLACHANAVLARYANRDLPVVP